MAYIRRGLLNKPFANTQSIINDINDGELTSLTAFISSEKQPGEDERGIELGRILLAIDNEQAIEAILNDAHVTQEIYDALVNISSVHGICTSRLCVLLKNSKVSTMEDTGQLNKSFSSQPYQLIKMMTGM